MSTMPEGTRDNPDRPPRDVKNHLLFEIATEVAHRGTLPTVAPPDHRLRSGLTHV